MWLRVGLQGDSSYSLRAVNVLEPVPWLPVIGLSCRLGKVIGEPVVYVQFIIPYRDLPINLILLFNAGKLVPEDIISGKCDPEMNSLIHANSMKSRHDMFLEELID